MNVDLNTTQGVTYWRERLHREYASTTFQKINLGSQKPRRLTPLATPWGTENTDLIVTNDDASLRQTLVKRIKTSLLAYAKQRSLEVSTGRTVLTNGFAVCDVLHTGKVPWDDFLRLLRNTFEILIGKEEALLLRRHFHMEEHCTISYLKFLDVVYKKPSKKKGKQPLKTKVLLVSSLREDPYSIAKERRNQNEIHEKAVDERCRYFLTLIASSSQKVAVVKNLSIQGALQYGYYAIMAHQKEQDFALGNIDSTKSLSMVPFFMAMEVTFNVHIDAIERTAIFARLIEKNEIDKDEIDKQEKENGAVTEPRITCKQFLQAFTRYAIFQTQN